MKRCCRCGDEKPLAEFWLNKQQRDGRHPHCKVCGRAARRLDALTPEQRERKRAGHRSWALNNPDAKRQNDQRTYAKHRESRLERAAAYREANRAKIREYFRANGRELRGRISKAQWCEYAKAYAKRYPERTRAVCQLRRARLAGAPGKVTAAEWRERTAEFNGRCAYCLQPCAAPTQDHFRPITKGGEHSIDNLVPACGSCNPSKRNGLVFDWVARGVGVCPPSTSASNSPSPNLRLTSG